MPTFYIAIASTFLGSIMPKNGGWGLNPMQAVAWPGTYQLEVHSKHFSRKWDAQEWRLQWCLIPNAGSCMASLVGKTGGNIRFYNL
jgi:hypothetical protein